ncbi:hypothetical protein K501DRAFT_283720 [Backusella circina FSU 941]|nr:hypothetical protein K501DRAFT_283720 [Backusella circina FSU 941]
MSTVQETRIYVGNISPDTTKVALKEAFEKVGSVSKLRVLQRRKKTIVYAFITFEAAADAKKAIGDLNETELDGNKIIVQEARPIDDEVLAQRKENKKNNRKLKRQAQQQAKKEETAAKKEGGDKKEEGAKTTEETETETRPKKNNRKRKVKEGAASEGVQSEPTKKDTPAANNKSPEPAKKEVKKGEAEAAKKEEKKTAKSEVKKEVDNKAKSTTANKEKSEEKAKKPEEKKDDEAKSSRISPETGVFVANLPFSAKTTDLQELFKNFNIKTAKIAKGRGGRRSKGYGFVEATTIEDQQKILKEFKEVEFKERIITVKPLLSKDDEE